MLDYSDPLSALFAALADPNRRAMVEALSRGAAPVGRLAEELPITLAATLQHVQALESAGLVETEKQGRSRICRLAPGGLGPLKEWVEAREAFWHAQFDQLAEYLDETSPKGAQDDDPVR
jgi:DNA-binding transcriptional ArsR family regulator